MNTHLVTLKSPIFLIVHGNSLYNLDLLKIFLFDLILMFLMAFHAMFVNKYSLQVLLNNVGTSHYLPNILHVLNNKSIVNEIALLEQAYLVDPCLFLLSSK